MFSQTNDRYNMLLKNEAYMELQHQRKKNIINKEKSKIHKENVILTNLLSHHGRTHNFLTHDIAQ